MNISIRNETPEDYRTVEELTREAFWGKMNHPTCDGEHLLVHKQRDLPSSYILQLTELGVRNPICSLIRSKAGISLYRVESEGKKLILKVFEKLEDAREIDNYLILSKLGIPTLPLLG